MWPTTPASDEKSKLIKWLIIAGVLVVAAVVFGLLTTRAYNGAHLRVTATRPDTNVASSATNIIFWYNRPISAETAKNFSITPNIEGSTVVKGTALIFTPKRTLDYDTKYTARVSKSSSVDGKYHIGNQKITFTIGYVPADQLPKDIQQRALSFTDSQPLDTVIDGEEKLIDQGVMSSQLKVVDNGLKSYFKRIKDPHDYLITIDNVEAAPYDSESSDPVATYNFKVLLNDQTYKGRLDAKPFGTTHFVLHDANGKTVYDSGEVDTSQGD